MYTLENILDRIEFLRNKMIEVAMNKGFTYSESVHISQEIDELLNLYDEVKSKQE
ncbi:aspartyl-phosphate phosphatase Spo0E family protein [Oceanobacillus rekensis]|uniref:aspartyl-phosphate phosphatase Spo0E family protein n=1 Tax=Oceanobacillus rekensis TaxID=937927 RepID=UPI000B436FB7|nr:aspartyl-phosphate phosphatase Spo0E family protein [Oceanobacillus rekensis]